MQFYANEGNLFIQIGNLVASDSCLSRHQLSTNTNQEVHAPCIWHCVAASHAVGHYYSHSQEMNHLFDTFEERGAHGIFWRSPGAAKEAPMIICHNFLIPLLNRMNIINRNFNRNYACNNIFILFSMHVCFIKHSNCWSTPGV